MDWKHRFRIHIHEKNIGALRGAQNERNVGKGVYVKKDTFVHPDGYIGENLVSYTRICFIILAFMLYIYLHVLLGTSCWQLYNLGQGLAEVDLVHDIEVALRSVLQRRHASPRSMLMS